MDISKVLLHFCEQTIKKKGGRKREGKEEEEKEDELSPHLAVAFATAGEDGHEEPPKMEDDSFIRSHFPDRSC
jgi:hypothetical protein